MRSIPIKKTLKNFVSTLEPAKYFFAIHKGQYCLVSKKGEKIAVAFIGEHAPPLDQLSVESVKLVVGLSSDQVLQRRLTLKLKSEREILSALPFQVENLLPFDPEELILLPRFSQNEKGTRISLLATSEKAVHNHLDLDPDILSCIPTALYRYARHTFPDRSSFFLRAEETLIAVVDNELQGFQTMKEKDEERVLAHFQKKYPSIQEPPITTGPYFKCAAAIGLALDGAVQDEASAQFRQKSNQSRKSRMIQKKVFTRFFILCACFIALVGLFGQLHLKKRERAALLSLGLSPKSKISREIHMLEQSLLKQKKTKTPVSPLPKVSELLAWLSAHPKLTECSIQRVRYELLRSPRLGSQIKTYSAKVELELTAENPGAARSFHEVLMRDRNIVDHKHEVKWSAESGIYRTTFLIKPRSL